MKRWRRRRINRRNKMPKILRPQITNIHERQMDASEAVCQDCSWYGNESDLTDYDDGKPAWRCPACDDGHVTWVDRRGEITTDDIQEFAGYFVAAAIWIHANDKAGRFLPTVSVDAGGIFHARILDNDRGRLNTGYDRDAWVGTVPETYDVEVVRCWVDDWERVLAHVEKDYAPAP